MIEIIETADNNFNLFINGKIATSKPFSSRENTVITTKDHEASRELASHKISELNFIEAVFLTEWCEWTPFVNFVFGLGFHENPKKFNLTFGFHPNLENWKYPFSFNEYYSKFIDIFNKKNKFKTEISDFDNEIGRFELDFFVENDGKTLVELITPCEMIIRECYFEAIDSLNLGTNFEAIASSFSFPKELKISCEQYLLYFAQFLQDLGINATSDLKEEAGKVLFSVTPTDDVEALDKIREALAIYLSLPSNPIPNSTGDRIVDMVLSGARANAKHLESQLELAIAKLQFKEATLELKDATIEHHHLALRQKDETIKDLQEIVARGNVFEESLERVEINGEVVAESSLYRFSREDDIKIEATPILDEKTEATRIGLVKFHEVTKLKDYGVSLDLPKAIRDLMNYFKRDKSE